MFCPSCGQEVKLDQSLGSLLTHFLNDYFTFDSKIIRSVLPLISKPAFLTIEYLRGRRVQYIAPFRLFIFLSLILFLLISWSNSSSVSLNEEVNGFNEAFWNRFFDSWLPKLFFFITAVCLDNCLALYKTEKRNDASFSICFTFSFFLIFYGYNICCSELYF